MVEIYNGLLRSSWYFMLMSSTAYRVFLCSYGLIRMSTVKFEEKLQMIFGNIMGM